ncbi:hypothetical protein ACTQ3M_08930 [Oscillospiraceae bacterium LCP25S3_E10]|nr:hypothetical protein [Ruminococcus sp.]MDD6447079.1 hypothetical protein [Ruminococcus sp.]MDY2856677.1 hypothetical protein [Oscillospiraceae bacterium]
MKIKNKVIEKLEENKITNTIIHNDRKRVFYLTTGSLIFDFCYALYNGALGLIYGSQWFAAMFIYYTILFVMRFVSVSGEYKNNVKDEKIPEMRIMRVVGIMLIFLSFLLVFIVYYYLNYDAVRRSYKIAMIAIAVYTVYKVVLSVANALKAIKKNSPLLSAIRNISCADAAVSLLSLQRSALAMFYGFTKDAVNMLNTITGACVCIFVFTLGAVMTFRKKYHNYKGD